MSNDNFKAVVDLQTHSFADSSYPVIMVTLPAHTMSTLEIMLFNPSRMAIYEKGDTALVLMVDSQKIADLDNRNGNFEQFKKLLDTDGMFVVTLTSCDEGAANVLHILTRTVVADNATGRVVSNTGPRKMSYDEACKLAEDTTPEDHATGRSFRDAVEVAVAMRDEVLKQDDSPVPYVN